MGKKSNLLKMLNYQNLKKVFIYFKKMYTKEIKIIYIHTNSHIT